MLKSHERFYSANGRRLLLVVDDEAVNRELLGFILSKEYEVIYAENGRAALEIIRKYDKMLSLILLDLLMPEMDGFELMAAMKSDDALRRIPIIVLTSEKSAEVRSLQMGASDFIAKPYDLPEVILARVQRTIELAEDTYIIQTTERDELTGLLNKGFFYRYAEQLELHHANVSMDAVVININHFHLVNELYGWQHGDTVLSRIGGKLMRMVPEIGGIAGRQDADMFLLYCPGGTDYAAVHDEILADLQEESGTAKIRIRMGVYPDVDRKLEMERRFDRAKLACDMIRENYTQFISYYDSSLHEKEFLSERLVDDMDKALQDRQFQVYYQPKYDVSGDKPTLKSAEALIRWEHPELGPVSPSVFVPLFEHNGLIQKLDRFVWREAAQQIRRWREKFGVTLPASVNVSRIDLYAPDFIDTLQRLMAENELSPADCLLEITESAYAEDAGQIVEKVQELRDLGYRIEMDDFGSGYSSLNMLTTLPVDVLKLDMDFIRNLHAGEKNARVLELMIGIAQYLNVPVVAEGVENEEQMRTLKEMGCNLIQGYYFSRPVSAEEFERFIEEAI